MYVCICLSYPTLRLVPEYKCRDFVLPLSPYITQKTLALKVENDFLATEKETL